MDPSSDNVLIHLTTKNDAIVIKCKSLNIFYKLQNLLDGSFETSFSAPMLDINFKPSKIGYKWVVVVNKEGLFRDLSANPFSIHYPIKGDIVIAQVSLHGKLVPFPRSDIDLLPEIIKNELIN